MEKTILETLTADRDIARLQSPKESYPILTRILGDYELLAKGGKKAPRTGDAVVVEVIRGILKGNAETIVLLQKSQGGEREHAAEIQRLETQSVLLQKYIPVEAEEEQAAPPAVDENALLDLLIENNFASVGLFHKFLRENYEGQYDPRQATTIFNAAKQGDA